MPQTHNVSINEQVLTKRYVSWSRDEHHSEWAALQLVSAATHDLVPTPLRFELDPPSVTMSLLPGSPLSGSLTATELDGLEVALRELWSVPADGLRQLAPASPEGSGRIMARVKESVMSWQGVGIVAEAHALALEWLAGPEPEQFLTPYADPVVGHGDPNLSNYLWDGSRVRIVDFEDAGRSDLAVELANLVEHLGARDTDWAEFITRFPVDPARFAAARCVWATFWLTLLRPGGSAALRNPAGTAEKQAERLITLLESGSS